MITGDLVRIKSGPFKNKTVRLKGKISYHNEKDPSDCGAWTVVIDGTLEMVYDHEIQLVVKLKRRAGKCL